MHLLSASPDDVLSGDGTDDLLTGQLLLGTDNCQLSLNSSVLYSIEDLFRAIEDITRSKSINNH